jgi:hypothetical protein
LRDCHTWSPVDVLGALHAAGAVDADTRDRLVADGFLDAALFRQLVEGAGYDSVVYANETEGGGDSIIVMDPEKIRFKHEQAHNEQHPARMRA